MFDERVNEDATIGRRGRPLRDYCYLVATSQEYDHLSWFDVLRDKTGWICLLVTCLSWAAEVPSVLWAIPLVWAFVRFAGRYWFLSPTNREEGARHILLLFEADGYWHRGEFIKGRGEVVKVLTDSNGPVPASTASHILESIVGVDWGEQSTDDQPRVVTRALKTYRRRPSGRRPFEIYSRSSVGFVSHMLGIHNPAIKTPADLMNYCERDAMALENVEAHLQAA